MLENPINVSIEAEGFKGEKKVFTQDYWQDIYSARQNRTILQGIASGIEEHEIGGKEKIPCLIIPFGNIKGILPLPNSGFTNRAQLRRMIGQQIAFQIVIIHRDTEMVELNRIRALEFMASNTRKTLEVGQTRTAVVRRLTSKQATLDIGGITTEMDAEEMSWGYVNDIRDMIQVGDSFDVKIIKLDEDKKNIKVSVRELLPKPWPECATRYARDGEYLATVSGIVDYGVFCNLETGVDALTPHPNLNRQNKIQRKNQTKKHLLVGDKVIIRVMNVDAKKEQIQATIAEII